MAEHMQLRSSNPILQSNAFKGNLISKTDGEMTMEGTTNKAGLLLLITTVCAYYTWNQPQLIGWLIPLLIAGLLTAIVTALKPQWSPISAPLYAVVQGGLLGILSTVFEQQYPGIAVQAIALTFCIFAAMLMAYRTGLIKATQKFKLGVAAATGGIMLLYLLSLVLRFFGITLGFLYDNSLLSIGFSLFVVVIAALNLVMDFDFIEEGCEHGCPKFMEWFAAFSLLVTLIWLYIEVLRLLAKIRSR